MKPTKQIFLFLGLAGAGLATGHVVKRITAPAAASATPAGVASAARPSSSGQDAAGTPSGTGSKAGTPAARSAPRPEDTLDSLKAATGPDLYARLALWMTDASAEDIAAYWQHYRQQGDRSNDINDLIFINWTRLDPQAATAAAKGTPDEHYAWWAWACHDPATALATAIATNPDRVNNVTWGIGEFHPAWLREHFDELPEGSRDNALAGMAKWDDGADPLEKLEFLEKHSRGFHPGIFKVLAMRDPWAAYDWLQRKGNNQTHFYYGQADSTTSFIDTVSEHHPEVLQRIIDQAPSGELRRRMESGLYKQLLETDPEAAVRQAKETEAPYIATSRLSAAAMHYLATDPDKAFELAATMFESYPAAMSQYKSVKVENSLMRFESDNEEVLAMVNALMAKDPARLVGMYVPSAEATGEEISRFSHLTGQWAETDLAGLAEWTKGHDDPRVRDHATEVIVNQLRSEENFSEAAAWAMSTSRTAGQLDSVMAHWSRSDPEAARAWLESADLPAERIEELENYLSREQP